MKPVYIMAVWAVFVITNIFIAEMNDATRRKRIKANNPKQINHFLWGTGYCLLCGIPFYISRNYWQLFSLLLLHIGIFPVAYNLFSGQLSMWNLSKTSTAITDRMMVKLGLKSTEAVNIAATGISILFIVFQIIGL